MSEVDQLLEGAIDAISSVRTCWLATRGKAGGLGARPMGRLPFDPATFDWRFRFLIDRRTAKARDVAEDSRVGIFFQRAEEAFVSIDGIARLVTRPTEVACRWQAAYDVYFPREAGRENAAFIEVEATRVQLWIRGVTPEPFGMRTTELHRDGSRWTLLR